MTTILKEMIVLLWKFHPYILPLQLALAILYILLFKITMVTCTDKLSPLKYGVIIIVMIFLYISSSI